MAEPPKFSFSNDSLTVNAAKFCEGHLQFLKQYVCKMEGCLQDRHGSQRFLFGKVIVSFEDIFWRTKESADLSGIHKSDSWSKCCFPGQTHWLVDLEGGA